MKCTQCGNEKLTKIYTPGSNYNKSELIILNDIDVFLCVECGHYEFFSTKKLKEYENKNVKKSNLEINRENVEYSLSNDDIENVGRILKGKDILPNANELIKLILNTCMEISKIRNFGVQTILDVLRKSQNQKIREYGLDELSCYGALKEIKREHLSKIIEILIEKSILYKTQGMYPIIKINYNKSIEEIDDETLIQIEEIISLYYKKNESKDIVTEDGIMITLDGWKVYINEDGELLTDMDLLKRLQVLRRKIGNERAVRYFLIAHNGVLVKLATIKPTTREDFLKIKGIKDKWFESNGEVFLQEIKDHLQNN